MRWIEPDFDDLNLSGEVTAYVNTDDAVRAAEQRVTRSDDAADTPQELPA